MTSTLANLPPRINFDKRANGRSMPRSDTKCPGRGVPPPSSSLHFAVCAAGPSDSAWGKFWGAPSRNLTRTYPGVAGSRNSCSKNKLNKPGGQYEHRKQNNSDHRRQPWHRPGEVMEVNNVSILFRNRWTGRRRNGLDRKSDGPGRQHVSQEEPKSRNHLQRTGKEQRKCQPAQSITRKCISR